MDNFLKKLQSLKKTVTLDGDRKELIRGNLLSMIRKEDQVESLGEVKEIMARRTKINGDSLKVRASDDAAKTQDIVKQRKPKKATGSKSKGK